MGYRHLTDEELINQATAELLSEGSNLIEVHKGLLNELVGRFERVLLSRAAHSQEQGGKDPDQLELF